VTVWKFGGASLADADGMRRVAALLEHERGPVVVVASALHGITDLLLEGARRAAAGDAAAGPRTAARFLERHRAIVRELVRPRRPQHDLLLLIDTAAREYRDLCRAVVSLRDLAPRTLDLMLARGERASSALLAAVLAESGRAAQYVDATDIVVTDGRYGQATPDFAATRPRALRQLRPLLRSGVVPVVTGYIGSAPDGSLTTLGRGGTDLTATTLGRVLGARRVVLWKD
jgi:aspartate kinase